MNTTHNEESDRILYETTQEIDSIICTVTIQRIQLLPMHNTLNVFFY